MAVLAPLGVDGVDPEHGDVLRLEELDRAVGLHPRFVAAGNLDVAAARAALVVALGDLEAVGHDGSDGARKVVSEVLGVGLGGNGLDEDHKRKQARIA